MPGRPARRRLRFLVWLLLVAGAVLVLLPVLRCRRRSAAPAIPPSDTAAPVVERDFRGARLLEGELFAGLMRRLDVADSLRPGIEAALDAAGFEFRMMHPGDSVTLEYADSLLAGFTYHLDIANGYAVELDPGGATARLVTRPVDTTTCVIRGEVSGSLWQSMTDAGAEPQLIEYYCELLRHKVKFPRAVEPGDTFALVAERLEVTGEFYRHGDILLARYAGRNASGTACLFRPDSGTGFYADTGGRSLSRLLDFPPVEHARRTSDFGPRMHPFRHRVINHAGMDYAAAYGAPVRSVADGTVVRRGWYGGYGRTVDVKHDGDLSTRYGHLCRYEPGLKVGSRVKRGQVVGYVGSSGVSTGFHLDFSVRRGTTPVDPLDALPSRYRQVPENRLPGFRAERDRLLALLVQD